MVINNITFNADLETILVELRNQLSANNVLLLQKMKPTSTHVMVQCPYHNNGQERRPSAGIRKEDGMFHCFACGEVHSLQEVISYCFGHTDDIVGKFGWQWLLRNFATVQVEERKDVELDLFRHDSARILGISVSHERAVGNDKKSSRTDTFVTEAELDGYRYTHPYMYKRGLTDDIVELFDIGFDADTDSITFPVRDISGNCLFIARRSVKTKFFHYPKGVEKPLYGLYELHKTWQEINNYYKGIDTDWFDNVADYDDVIVTESMFDALSFWTIGKHAVALNGLGNELQIKQLRALPCRGIILATDMDEKGLEARTKLKSKLQDIKIVKQYFFPEGRKDANECTKEELRNLEEVF